MNTNIRIFADSVDEWAARQIRTLTEQAAFADAKVRIMPDVHAGKGCVIGFTADLGAKVIPNIVGVDIGCGMLTVHLGHQKPDFAALDAVMHSEIPSGMSVNASPVEDFSELETLHCFDALRQVPHLRRGLGSLGGGNHFVEVDGDSKGGYHLVIHSGSRNLGKQVCELYQEEAVNRCSGLGGRLTEDIQKLIADYRAAGRQSELQGAIRALHAAYTERHPALLPDLCYLEGESRRRYLDDMRICQRYACRNRELIAEHIVHRLGLDVQGLFHTVHNYIDHESNIVRKGAISARAGEPLLIPINMRDGCIFGIGKGNAEWNCSAPHGAGRVMSRTAARRTLSVEEFRRQMEGVWSTTVNSDTLDEAPMAYKSIDAILGHLEPTAEVRDIWKPLYNFKAAEEVFPRPKTP